jgi:hypothetical protein
LEGAQGAPAAPAAPASPEAPPGEAATGAGRKRPSHAILVERANQATAYLLASERRRAVLYVISTALLVANALLIFAFAPYSQGMGIVILGASLALDLTILFEVRHGSSRIVTDPSRAARASRVFRASRASSRWLLCRCDVAPPLHHLALAPRPRSI